MASISDDAGKQEISEVEIPKIDQLPFEYVNKPTNKTALLLANATNRKSTEGQNRWYEYTFKKPVFLQAIVVNHQNYSEFSSFSVEVDDFEGTLTRYKSKIDNGRTTCIVNVLAKSVRFQPPKDYFFKNKILSSVFLFGFDADKAGEFIEYARRIEDIKSSSLDLIEKREEIYRNKIAEAELAVTKVSEATKELQALKGQSQRQRTAI